ncbi:MAG TPA: ECF-type sigma factor [Acidobacteriota bacterium]|nr:ECF-type sigma factor [Acidobacteriota bacterium]
MKKEQEQILTEFITAWNEADQEKIEITIQVAYERLRTLAHRYLNHKRRIFPKYQDYTLDTTALVNELYCRLVDQNKRWENPDHFFANASILIRFIFTDYQRRHKAEIRGGGIIKLPLDEATNLPAQEINFRTSNLTDWIDLMDCEKIWLKLEEFDEVQAKTIGLRLYGFTIEEIAEILGISATTVKTKWKTGRLFLFQELQKNRNSLLDK